MKLGSVLSLQEIIKNMKVKKFSQKTTECCEGTGGGGDGGGAGNTARTKEIIKDVEAKKDNKEAKSKRRSSWLYRVSMRVVGLVEDGCGAWGKAVATYPARATLFCFLMVTACALGLLNLSSELRPYKLWIPQDSDFTRVNEWKAVNFPNEFRRHVVLWEAENIMTARAIQSMWQLHQRIESLSVPVGGDEDDTITWDDVCTRVPSLLANKTSSEESTMNDYSDEFYYNTTWPPLNWTNYEWNDNSSLNWTSNWSDYNYDYDYDEKWGTEYPPVSNLTDEEQWILSAVSEEVLQTVRDDYSLILTRPAYCELLESKPHLCYETSLLEVWGYDNDIIMNLTDEKVVKDINEAFMSNVYGYPTEYAKYLGSIKRDVNGDIIAARASLHTWTTRIRKNKTTVVDLGTGDVVDEGGMAWEIALVKEVRSVAIPGITPHVHAAHSFGEVSTSTIMGDIKWVVGGWVALILYVLVTLGRPLPAIVGLICVAVAVAAAYGLCSAIGVPYGPINSVLPVLLIGLGVDDMYVIVAAWETSGGIVSLEERAKKALRHAGVAVTVTSMTDAVAFLVGATTQVPALRWFCIYAAVGVCAVYFLQGTVFVAALSIDQRYRDGRKTGCCKPTETNKYSLSWAMRGYAQIVVLPVTRVIVLIVAILMLSVGAWGALSLRQEFSPIWFLPRSSYLYKWFTAMDSHFPSDGERGTVYFSNVSLPKEIPALRDLAASLRASPYITQVDAWFSVLDVYIHEDNQYDVLNLTSEALHDVLGIFLNSKSGAQFRNHFRFDGDLSCEEPAPPFSVFKVEFQYARLDDRSDQQAAMADVRQVVAAANLSGYHAAWAHVYSQWETDSTLGSELWRNLGVVVVVVAAMTLLLLAAARAAFLVLLSVLATLVDVAALMHAWGLTVDTVSCIALVLAIGLCVDYSAHVAHAFLVVEGSKRERAQAAIAGVGPAVLHGGFSTLLAFIMLSPSDSHLFLSFFKIFTGVSLFGLFHGLVLLPVLLSLIGPEPYPDPSEHGPSLTAVVVQSNKDSNSYTCNHGTDTRTVSSNGIISQNPTLTNNQFSKDNDQIYNNHNCQQFHHSDKQVMDPQPKCPLKTEDPETPINIKDINMDSKKADHVIRLYVKDTLRKSVVRRRSSSRENSDVEDGEAGLDNPAYIPET